MSSKQGEKIDGSPTAGKDDSVNVVWTGLNAWATSPQVDFYTGQLHQGYRQDAILARR